MNTQAAKPFGAAHTSSAYSVIDAAVTDAVLKSHIAHELTHTSQFQYDYAESAWLLDGTATWSAYRVLQKLGIEPTPAYEYLPDLFATLDDGDPRSYYRVWNDLCGWKAVDARWLYTTLALVSGTIPADRTSLSSSVQRSVPSLSGLDDIPTIESITWSIDL